MLEHVRIARHGEEGKNVNREYIRLVLQVPATEPNRAFMLKAFAAIQKTSAPPSPDVVLKLELIGLIGMKGNVPPKKVKAPAIPPVPPTA